MLISNNICLWTNSPWEADPKRANILGNYANFLANQMQDYTQAEVMYQRALEADPKRANILGNYAKLLFVKQEKSQARQCLEEAEIQPNLHPSLSVELAFYRYAHCPPHMLTLLKQQLQSGARSIGWNLTHNVHRANADGHPYPDLLAAIAGVISDGQSVATLEQFSEWTQTP